MKPMYKIRLLPVLVLTAVLTLGTKVETIVTGAGKIDISPALAEPKTDKVNSDRAADEGKATADQATNAQNESSESPSVKTAGPKYTGFTRAEVEVLQSLAQRRQALERQASEIAMRDGILKATERRIDEKIAQLKVLESRIEGMLSQHDAEEEAQLKSLVKVYEAMKPKEAARIFQELDLPILIAVAERMREVKMAPILARMDPSLAKDLTVELATKRRLPKIGG